MSKLKSFYIKLKKKFLCLVGETKIFKFPFWVVYDPIIIKIKGADIRKFLDTVQPGDIVGHGYRSYLDGFFIPGDISHTGIYIGNGTVIHAVGKGVSTEDILDFLLADKIVIYRPKDQTRVNAAIEKAKSLLGVGYDFEFKPGTDYLYCHELSATCYEGLSIEKHIPVALGGFLKGKYPTYLAQSFEESPDFETVLKI